eukprot:NODE_147_length_17537_cov_0.265627.p8 type:complete len:209 gc:universal NODE_147_length_17537_cov_0.265627:1703-1077(-)
MRLVVSRWLHASLLIIGLLIPLWLRLDWLLHSLLFFFVSRNQVLNFLTYRLFLMLLRIFTFLNRDPLLVSILWVSWLLSIALRNTALGMTLNRSMIMALRIALCMSYSLLWYTLLSYTLLRYSLLCIPLALIRHSLLALIRYSLLCIPLALTRHSLLTLIRYSLLILSITRLQITILCRCRLTLRICLALRILCIVCILLIWIHCPKA